MLLSTTAPYYMERFFFFVGLFLSPIKNTKFKEDTGSYFLELITRLIAYRVIMSSLFCRPMPLVYSVHYKSPLGSLHKPMAKLGLLSVGTLTFFKDPYH